MTKLEAFLDSVDGIESYIAFGFILGVLFLLLALGKWVNWKNKRNGDNNGQK